VVIERNPEHTWERYLELMDENTRLQEQYQTALDALREACLHQGLPEDAPPDRIAAHFRNNREFRESAEVYDRMADASA
jgi:DICT domain-containing protein